MCRTKKESFTMLYIFRVDTGTMINLEMNLALETVTYLKKSVASTWGIPAEKQVRNGFI